MWDEEFIFRVIPTEHKLVLQVFDENRLTRDDFLGMIELSLISIPNEAEGRVIPPKKYNLQPRSVRSKVKGFIHIYAAFVPDPTEHSREESRNGASEETVPVPDETLPSFTSRPGDSSANNNAGPSTQKYKRSI